MSNDQCVFVESGENERQCIACGRTMQTSSPPDRCFRNCIKKPPTGAGTILKRELRLLMVAPSQECGCEQLAQKMDRNGPDWCEQNADFIVDKMAEHAKKSGASFSRMIATMALTQAIAEARELRAAAAWD